MEDANSKLFDCLLNVILFQNWKQKMEFLWRMWRKFRRRVEFYEKLYESLGGEFSGVEGLDWSPISTPAVESLEMPFEEDEIKRAVFNFDGNKAPGLNGFTLSFFQECSDFVKVNVLHAIKEFWRTRIINCITNKTHLFDP